jgi:hypothetical protein
MDESSRSLASPWEWKYSGAKEDYQDVANQPLSEFPMHTQPDSAFAVTRDAGRNSELSAGYGVQSTNNPPLQPLRDETFFNETQSPPVAPIGFESAVRWSPSGPADQEVAIRREPANATMPMSAAQIEQILDALEDRLELMLLRMYGTTSS